MNIAVLIKQVPVSNDVSVDPETHALVRASSEGMINPADLNAIESAMILKEQTEGRLLLCFVGGFLHVAVNSGHNAFEPPVFRRINGEELRNGTIHDISVITRFVDALRLDRNLFKE